MKENTVFDTLLTFRFKLYALIRILNTFRHCKEIIKVIIIVSTLKIVMNTQTIICLVNIDATLLKVSTLQIVMNTQTKIHLVNIDASLLKTTELFFMEILHFVEYFWTLNRETRSGLASD